MATNKVDAPTLVSLLDGTVTAFEYVNPVLDKVCNSTVSHCRISRRCCSLKLPLCACVCMSDRGHAAGAERVADQEDQLHGGLPDAARTQAPPLQRGETRPLFQSRSRGEPGLPVRALPACLCPPVSHSARQLASLSSSCWLMLVLSLPALCLQPRRAGPADLSHRQHLPR